MLKVLLAYPPHYRLKGFSQNSIPLGVCYLGAELERHGHEVRILNAEHTKEGHYHHNKPDEWSKEIEAFTEYRKRDFREHEVWKMIRNEIETFQPDVLGLTVRSSVVSSSIHFAKIAKELHNDIVTVFGGPHPTVLPEEMLSSPVVDFAVRGEGEKTLLELVEALEGKRRFSIIPGLSYKEDGQIINNHDRPLLPIDDILHPARHLMAHLEDHDQDDFGFFTSSRGCPFDCIFCGSRTIWTRKVRFRDPHDVALEMANTYEQFDTHFFTGIDDTFTVNTNHARKVCEKIIEFGLPKVPGFRWNCNTRPETLTPDVLDIMRESGCAAVGIGVESGNEGILKRMNKQYTVADVRRAAKMVKEADLFLTVQFMFGLPFETESEMRETVKLAEEIEAHSVRLSVATPLPGTPLYYEAKAMGYFSEGIDWDDVMLRNDGIIFNKIYNPKEKNRIMSQIIGEFQRIEEKTKSIKIGKIEEYESLYKNNLPQMGLNGKKEG